MKRAVKQLPKDEKNLIIFAGDLEVPLSSDDTELRNVLYGKEVINFYVNNKGEPIAEPYFKRIFNGVFQPTVNTRISAVALMEFTIKSPYLDSVLLEALSQGKVKSNRKLTKNKPVYIFKIYHNPFAKNPLDLCIFRKYVQYYLNKKCNKLVERKKI